MYKELFEIIIDHQYFTSGSVDLTIKPTADTLKLLDKSHFRVRPIRNGLRVYIHANEEGKVHKVVDAIEKFQFDLFPKSSAYQLYTDLGDLKAGEIILFTNPTVKTQEVVLEVSSVVAAGQYQGYPLVGRVALNVVDLSIGGGMQTFRAVLKSPAIKWRYYLLSDNSNTELVIQDRNNHFTFHQQEIPGAEEDLIAHALQLNYPDLNLSLFESKQAILSSNKPVKNLQLIRDGEVLIRHLPNPSASHSGIKIIKAIRANA
ncbi:hypothetical protein [Fulvivirga sediminis]|uniref:Uncharacterized protein n=1 Tax=Fulvivirga sediminis TaxID=2803949 RepID=A0A937F5T6_9BACT|nr:hypothetical protein [Fulvivirga sediminis]MBL3655546.1 hypothetical protein [Fulvivirga sediminis]